MSRMAWLVASSLVLAGCGGAELEEHVLDVGETPDWEHEESVPEPELREAELPLSAVSEDAARKATMDAARGELGVSEQGNPARIDEYTKGRGGAWCSEFASWSLERGGGSLMGYRYSWDSIWSWASSSGRVTERPRPGDLVIFDGHTALVESVGTDGTFTTIGGNESDAVRRARRSFSSSWLMGFVNPYRSSGGSTSGGSGGGSTSGAGCYSQTLGATVASGTCIQAASDALWSKCVDGRFSGSATQTKPSGCGTSYPYCASGTLGRSVPARTCVQSSWDDQWYQCGAQGQWVSGSSTSGPLGSCSGRYPR